MNDTLKSTLLAMATAALTFGAGCGGGNDETASSTQGTTGGETAGQGRCGGQGGCGAGRCGGGAGAAHDATCTCQHGSGSCCAHHGTGECTCGCMQHQGAAPTDGSTPPADGPGSCTAPSTTSP